MAAVLLAIVSKKNVTLRPEYRDKVYLYGQVGNPSKSNPEIKACDWIETTGVESVYFEKAHEKNGIVSLHCYVKTRNSTYRIWDNEMARLTDMHFLLQDLGERELKLEDFIEYITDINTNYHEVLVVD